MPLRDQNSLKLRPKKYLGQNFLVDKNILQKIIVVAEIKKSDYVLEVGPGRGVLTAELAKSAKRVLAVEKDKDLIADLNQNEWGNVRVLQADILKVTDEQLRCEFKDHAYRVIANLPYNISSEFLRLFLEREYAPKAMLLMLQREVAERICSKDGENSVLSLAVQFFADPVIRFLVKKNSFFPSPKVDSAIIEIKNIRKDKYPIDPGKFFQVVKKGFAQKRKQLKNNLKEFGEARVVDVLSVLGYSENCRAEELALNDWVKLAQGLF